MTFLPLLVPMSFLHLLSSAACSSLEQNELFMIGKCERVLIMSIDESGQWGDLFIIFQVYKWFCTLFSPIPFLIFFSSFWCCFMSVWGGECKVVIFAYCYGHDVFLFNLYFLVLGLQPVGVLWLSRFYWLDRWPCLVLSWVGSLCWCHPGHEFSFVSVLLIIFLPLCYWLYSFCFLG